MVTHLPNKEGYHAGRFDVVQTCLKSMTQNADLPYTLAIWDNDSCSEFREWVRDVIRPDVFVESMNLGKTGGRTALMRMLPPGRVACYSDDDMYFYPGWLSPQVELLQHFPNVACVTGYPVRTAFRWGCGNTMAWAKQHATLESGRFLPQQWEDEFAASVGRIPSWHRDYTRNDLDWRITYKGRQAYATSHHCQFIAMSDVVGRVLTWDDMAMGDEKPFDVTLDNIGLRLATTERYTRHIGNVLHDELREEIARLERVQGTGVCPAKE